MLKKKHLTAGLLLILMVVFCFVPVPAYIETVGDAQNVGKYVSVNGAKDTRNGAFMLTYVELGHATPALYVASYFDKYATRLPSSAVTGDNNSTEYKRVQHYYMDDALNQAKAVSLKLAGKPIRQSFEGIVVMSLLSSSDFKGKLRAGDIIIGVDGRRCVKVADLLRYVQHTKGDTVAVRFQRGKKEKTVRGRLERLPQTARKGIGISFIQKSEVVSPVKIKTDMEGIQGPSAGLMLSLEMYTQLTHENLKQGRRIAGTGTILADGTVGEIGGIDKKVVAAAKKKADIFFAPDNVLSDKEKAAGKLNNYQEAQKMVHKLSTKMKVVPVKNIQDALAYLR
ncbi:Lon-like protease [Liquorilactobacillus sucicola DSM 21376 = JCM 15457]|uniref:ATP-dependent protease La n=1 Tax=Liquorilactobacillus sucicola DSM 21376 = JCM 15457 TaxID=1423806 RepID=A0A023CU27_9LACO|nr:SepM family pheromone-processing serine protease [Liquorilactobacillus sucicola]KRN05290.1 ATP-dependent protease La [Liquorilactobacillus sucicola DSM 21376 = JCM 15457]GAJ25353.1 Lon-like protease [Liquorilactobacillus sucicola DSM 21376 = JCM 15457]